MRLMRVLVIDDEPDVRLTLAHLLKRLGASAETAEDVASGLAAARTKAFDLVITDLRLPDGSGMDIVLTLEQERPTLPVAVLTAYGDIDTAVAAMKHGAVDFLTKPVSRERLAQLLQAVAALRRDRISSRWEVVGESGAGKALSQAGKSLTSTDVVVPKPAEGHQASAWAPGASSSQTALWAPVSTTQHAPFPAPDSDPKVRSGSTLSPPEVPVWVEERLVGQSPAIVVVRQQLVRFARSLAPVLIQGPSGSGKECCARLLHELSPRRDAPFVAINCGAIPADLIEAELFGALKGAYTGAHSDRRGLVAQAEGGTLFLDEIAELPLALQPKLLRLLQERTIRPLGAAKERAVDVRIVAATHVDLAAAVAAGRFREDLYYRLAVLVLTLPALAQRVEDIPLLATALLERVARRNGMAAPQLTAEALAFLQQHAWPGNVRELENWLERALVYAEGAVTREVLEACAPASGVATSRGVAVGECSEPLFLPLSVGESNDLRPPLQAEASLQPAPALQVLRTWLAGASDLAPVAQRLGLTERQLRYRLEKWGLMASSR